MSEQVAHSKRKFKLERKKYFLNKKVNLNVRKMKIFGNFLVAAVMAGYSMPFLKRGYSMPLFKRGYSMPMIKRAPLTRDELDQALEQEKRGYSIPLFKRGYSMPLFKRSLSQFNEEE